jgi:hypothetical protein
VHKTEGGQEILREVSDFLEEKLTGQLPAPPVTLNTERAKTKEYLKKQMISLSVGCSEAEPPQENIVEQAQNQSAVSYEEVELRSVSLTIQLQPVLEDAIFHYAKECKGEIDIDQCALDFDVSQREIESALESLGEKRKIMIQR